MKTVPLHGKKAAGRVALVSDGDYDLVMQYRWHVHEPAPAKPGMRPKGPYAVANSHATGKHTVIRMHCLIMGVKGVDHADHNGLNNQRSNLRVATGSQNNQNARKRFETSSRYKGVCEVRPGWFRAYIAKEGRRRILGEFASELEAAYTYDAVAREWFGEFAHPNFPEGPTQAMRDQWQMEAQARSAVIMTAAREAQTEGIVQWWAQRETGTKTCMDCGTEFQSRAQSPKVRCPECKPAAAIRQKREWRADRRRRGEKVV